MDKLATIELLYQLADDDFIHAYRGSEWLGLSPHIEEDVASASINQDTMGHAFMLYGLLSDLGEGSIDELAHGRTNKDQWRNAIVVELPNGPGGYKEEPRYDFALAVVRNYFYIVAKLVKVHSLKESSYEPLKNISTKMSMELFYHHLHWKTWFVQLFTAGGEAKTRMSQALTIILQEAEGLFDMGALESNIVAEGLISSKQELIHSFQQFIEPTLKNASIEAPLKIDMKMGNGRNRNHTKHLQSAIQTFSEVYSSDPTATW
ncbi:phenylacetate-CoA oxygenase [Bacillus coahuilensis m2-6]|uniref:1,2-phenylacetyl-CoA epoxidase subunit PaaC n=1 Tax=Bacillus coahuilensis TaxID=408580 RepID=UPI0001850B82|nr:1,2-phenylacetyl-CoA epoxidase subunit PaaC [Bacillus coahuilensis]KUP09294.1 phenylacetate-CoA oxygenase [Bacillus coahuilensis m2-6]